VATVGNGRKKSGCCGVGANGGTQQSGPKQNVRGTNTRKIGGGRWERKEAGLGDDDIGGETGW